MTNGCVFVSRSPVELREGQKNVRRKSEPVTSPAHSLKLEIYSSFYLPFTLFLTNRHLYSCFQTTFCSMDYSIGIVKLSKIMVDSSAIVR